VLVVWSAVGPLGYWYSNHGGPLGIWRALAHDVHGHAVAGGHFFPEEHPCATAQTLSEFFCGTE
jgi:haloacetate dehalogenase